MRCTPRASLWRRRACAVALVVLLLALPAGAQRHEDAVPTIPPGFEPFDVGDEVHQIQAREVRQMEAQVDIDRHYRTITPETRIRSRYGFSTWNMYEPYR
jgi:hypothetical protein